MVAFAFPLLGHAGPLVLAAQGAAPLPFAGLPSGLLLKASWRLFRPRGERHLDLEWRLRPLGVR